MKDSILKGAGNSRFLKSAVPAGTSWADALAMLQAGTFPIDFNGINAEGFQQVGTPLNKANLLKDATAAQIGLPPSTTPDGMFQALGNTGELHVWRKTVKNAADVPAGYNLGAKTTKTILNTTGDSGGVSTIYYSSSVSVSDSGEVSLKNPASTGVKIYTSSLPIVGKFFYIVLSTVHTSDLIQKKIYFVPSDTDISVDDSPKAFSGVVQEVTGYAKVPAGTTTTYPVSTNPNAYQEGSDAKPAGYVVGDAITGKFVTGGSTSAQIVYWNCSSTIEVHNDGNLALISPTTYQIYADNKSAVRALLGKFAVVTNGENYISGSPFAQKQIVYIPSDAVVDTNRMSIDRYQPVTGYAAIPAGTTIEYLGKLGDKARVQVVSYVGTGTYGKNNPCSLTFDFPPKVVLFLRGYKRGFGQFSYLYDNYSGDILVIVTADLSEEFTGYNGFGCFDKAFAKKDTTGCVISWYNTKNAFNQANEKGSTYYFLAIS